jgi:hypothetical protein
MDSLIFVYNADSGLANALLDTGHRLIKPADYPCSLCMATYGPFGMKRDWKEFIAKLPYKVTFLHKNELSQELKKELNDFPCLVLQSAELTRTLISGAEFRQIKDLSMLKKKVTVALKILGNDLQ